MDEKTQEIEKEKQNLKVLEQSEYKKQMDEKTQEIEKENQNLKALEESDNAPQSEIAKSREKIRLLQIEKESLTSAKLNADLKNSDAPQSEIAKSREKIRLLQIEKEALNSAYKFADLKNSAAPQREIEKQQAELRKSEGNFTKARADYNKRFPSERYESNIIEDFEEVEDDEEPEIFDERQRIKSIIKQNEALRSRMVTDRYISENTEQAPERREAAKKKTGNKSSNL